MSRYANLADLPLRIDDWSLAPHRRDTSSDFERVTTEFVLDGPDATGRGEDVTYDAVDHDELAAEALDLPTGEFTVDEFSAALDGVDLFPTKPPERDVSRDYRRWAVESAALDLALRQAGESLASALGASYDPVSFVVSTRLGDPPTTDRIESLLAIHDDLPFKLDPTAEWDRDLAASVADLATVRILDLKGLYTGTGVDGTADPDLYELVFETFPDAVIEDPGVTDGTEAIVAAGADRLSWDSPIHGVDDLDRLPFEPRWINVKPSRFGTVESLFETIEACEERGVSLYGGGQFELGVGRAAIQALASVCYPDGPNDVAPMAYNDPTVETTPPASPLDPPEDPVGLSFQ
jgi:L-alanine-DL-glutamate epimerase-like enolase superfamily enzyme